MVRLPTIIVLLAQNQSRLVNHHRMKKCRLLGKNKCLQARLFSLRTSQLSEDKECISYRIDDVFNDKDSRNSIKKSFIERSQQCKVDTTAKYDRIKSKYGVLLPICKVNDKPSLLYTKRTMHLTRHGGEVSFPGGKMDKTDKSPLEAALRETEEELGINCNAVDVWTTMPVVQGRADKGGITPVVGFLGDIDISVLKLNDGEVADVFALPLSYLLKRENQASTQFRHGARLPVFLNGRYRVWGLTAVLTELLLVNMFPGHYVSKFSRISSNISMSYVSK